MSEKLALRAKAADFHRLVNIPLELWRQRYINYVSHVVIVLHYRPCGHCNILYYKIENVVHDESTYGFVQKVVLETTRDKPQEAFGTAVRSRERLVPAASRHLESLRDTKLKMPPRASSNLLRLGECSQETAEVPRREN